MRRVAGIAVSAFIVLTGTGCVGSLSPKGARVEIAAAEPPATCHAVGPVHAEASLVIGGRVEDKVNVEVRNEAAEMGANYVRVQSLLPSSITGTAYACPEARGGAQ